MHISRAHQISTDFPGSAVIVGGRTVGDGFIDGDGI